MAARAWAQTCSETETWALGRALAEALVPGDVVGLQGPMGAGKTRLVQGIGAGLGVDPREVTSPTYALVHTYRGRLPVYHLDLYRVGDADEVEATGVLDLAGEGVVLVEWIDRAPEVLGPGGVRVTIEVGPGEVRCWRFEDASEGGRVAARVLAYARGRMSQ